ncbi:MAG: hypothetical protein CMO55_17060 [Verrucomicrobiales bacterium]|nr:hypothetical protein [Verrucomicrobiales bacterium]
MPEKLNSKQWARAVASRRTVEPKPFTEQVRQQKATRPSSLTGKEWTKRIEQVRQSTKGGGRHRGLTPPSHSKVRQRQIGGFLKSNQPKSRPILTEAQRQALPKTGDQTPKKGINAESWTYDHRKATAARRNITTQPGEKKGINAGKWHYDHQKAKSQQKTGTKVKPTTHLSPEKKRTQSDAIAKHQPRQPARPTQPKAKPAPKTPPRTPRK